MIDDEALYIYIKNKNFIEFLEGNNDDLVSALKELRIRRDSALKPATKFLNDDLNSISELFHKILEETAEVGDAYSEYVKQKNNEKIRNNLAEKIIDVQFACETALSKLLPLEKHRLKARRQVIKKNTDRGYYI